MLGVESLEPKDVICQLPENLSSRSSVLSPSTAVSLWQDMALQQDLLPFPVVLFCCYASLHVYPCVHIYRSEPHPPVALFSFSGRCINPTELETDGNMWGCCKGLCLISLRSQVALIHSFIIHSCISCPECATPETVLGAMGTMIKFKAQPLPSSCFHPSVRNRPAIGECNGAMKLL